VIELVKRHEVKYLGLCMVLLCFAVGWLVLTRPPHLIEADFLQREDRRVVDRWLLEQLNNPIAEHRARACLALGRIGSPDTLSVLLTALREPIPHVRAAAAFALGEIEDRATAAETGREPREEAANALIESLRDPERTVAEHAVEALGKLRWEAAYPRITETPAPLSVTMTALVRLGNRDAIPWIAARRRSDNQETRWAATRALLDLGADVEGEITRSFLNLTRDLNPWVRIAAVSGLSRAEHSEEVLETLARMSNDPDAKVRVEALNSLAATRNPRVFDVLVKSLGDRNENVRLAAVDALGFLGGTRARPLLESLLSESQLLSLRAELALARLGLFSPLPGESVLPPRYAGPGFPVFIELLRLRNSDQATPLLSSLWRSPSEDLTALKPDILRELASRISSSSGDLIAQALDHSDANVVRAALELISEPPLAPCRASYARGLDGGDVGLRLATLDAAARSPSRDETHAFLLETLEDPDRLVRKRAVRYLRILFGESRDEKIGVVEVDYDSSDYQRFARSRSRLIRMETSVGPLELRLDYPNAALTAENFVRLAREGHYDGQRFSEVLTGKYAKVGGPAGPGRTIRTEINYEPFLRGSLAMAETEKDSAGSRFFICLAPQPLWEGQYTNFGRLTSGDDLLDRITPETRILRIVVP
jgi:HEAT repeat protein/cyclophilin family peptidyl-prolyl cis-trans isomerase